MASYDTQTLVLNVPSDWRILLLMHDTMRPVVDDEEDGLIYEISEKGTAYANAIKGLHLHGDLSRFADEMMKVGAEHGHD